MTDDIYETPSTTPNFQTELAAQLADLIPEAIADGKVDVEKLKELLDGDVADSSERFGLFWPGKKRALRAAQEPTTATLKPDFENSKDWDTTQNVFIEGDNLEVLKILQKHYHNKVKLIFIDPPYNTGKDFVYPDNYKEGLDTYLEWTRQVNAEGKKLSTNADTEGRYHSNWLNMMYPRLKLARNLLTDDGVIFISIDDKEAAHLRKVCDEVFGEGNFVAAIAWQKKYTISNDDPGIASMHDTLLAYRRSSAFSRYLLPRTSDQLQAYTNPDNDTRGPWISSAITSNKSRSERPTLWYPIRHPRTGEEVWPKENRVWAYAKSEYERLVAEDRLYWGEGQNYEKPRQKRFLSEARDGVVPRTWWTYQEAGSNDEGQRETTDLLGGRVFSAPKPTKLIRRISLLATREDDLILDFFAGSGTTAHAIMQLNAEDGGSRRCISVQLPEPTPAKSSAREAGYETIAEITRERLRRAGERIREDHADKLDTGQAIDVGYRAYRLADTNFSKWRLSSDVEEDALQQHLLSLRDSATDDASADDLLTEILLKQGYSLTEAVSPDEVGGLDVRLVRDRDGDIAVLAYLNEHVKPTLDQLRALVDESPVRIIVLEDAFQGDDELKTNLAQLARAKGIELWTA